MCLLWFLFFLIMLSQCTYIGVFLYFTSFQDSGNIALQVSTHPGNILLKTIKQTTYIMVLKSDILNPFHYRYVNEKKFIFRSFEEPAAFGNVIRRNRLLHLPEAWPSNTLSCVRT